MTLRVFRGESLSHIFFQPRIEPWYAWHKQFNRLPERYQNLTLQELFDDLHVSMRYVHYYTGMPDPVVRQFDQHVKVHQRWDEREGWVTYETPHGDLTERYVRTVDETWREVQFPVRNVDDLKALRWLYQHTTFTFSPQNFQKGSAFVGDRGEPQFWVPKSPYQALAQVWMRLEDLIYALADYPQVVEDTMRAIDDSYDVLYQQITDSGLVHIVNFGENIHDSLLSPAYFERYLVPFWEKRSGQLRKAGIFTHMHLDGYFRSLLPYLKHLPFDGLEALTPLPQGDVTLEEIKGHLGDKILLDGIPAILFLPPFTREQLMETVEKIVRLFHPRLVLGISDELPEGGGEEAIERVRLVAQWCLQQGMG